MTVGRVLEGEDPVLLDFEDASRHAGVVLVVVAAEEVGDAEVVDQKLHDSCGHLRERRLEALIGRFKERRGLIGGSSGQALSVRSVRESCFQCSNERMKTYRDLCLFVIIKFWGN